MNRLTLLLSILVAFSCLVLYNKSSTTLRSFLFTNITTTTTSNIENNKPMLNSSTVKTAMSKALHHAKITPHRSTTRGHSDHGWLKTYHSFSFADWYDPRYVHFGALRVLNEDRVKPQSGFPTHPHRDFEIFSYILAGELTHRDSMLPKGAEGAQSDKFYRMRRGDVQFTTGGTGIAHSEMNEHRSDTVHFLQIWALPWKKGLTPRYHTRNFPEEEKRKGFMKILSPLKAGHDASKQEEEEAKPTIDGTIPIHADLVMAAGIIAPEAKFEWKIGADAKFGPDGTQATKRKVFVHLPMTKNGKAKIRVDGRDDALLSEGDGAFIDNVNATDKLVIESVGTAGAEVILLDSEA